MSIPDHTRRAVLSGAIAALVTPATAQAPPDRRVTDLLSAARAQVGVTLSYDPAYTRLAFPGGDVDRATGVCTDVLVRAYRDALGLDLQALVNGDMRAAFAAYPNRWGLMRPDPSIDHRRVPNLQRFLSRKGTKLDLPNAATPWQPGDIFTSLIGGRLPHIGFISDRRSAAGGPLVIHNIGQGAREEDALADHPPTGRYRWAIG